MGQLKAMVGKGFNPKKMVQVTVVLASYIQEKYPEEYKKYCDELEPWMKSKGLKF